MITITDIITDHVVNKIGDRLYWSFTSIDDISIEDVYTMVNFYYDDEICQMVKSSMKIIQKIMEKVEELSEIYG